MSIFKLGKIRELFVPKSIRRFCSENLSLEENQLAFLRSISNLQMYEHLRADQAGRRERVAAAKRMAALTTPELPVVFITDSNYLRPTIVAISSLLRHRRESTKYRVFVLGTGLTEADQKSLSKISEVVTLLEMNRMQWDGLLEHRHVSTAALFKFQLPTIFRQYDKILYLDSDIVVREDLTELFAVDLDGLYAAAVSDPVAMLRDHHECRLKRSRYFNSGVMLLNLEKMRCDNMTQMLIDEKMKDTSNFFMDQDVLNIVFQDKVAKLPPKFNWMEGNVAATRLTFEKLSKLYGISQGQLRIWAFNPAIEHLSNINKPWNSNEAKRAERWDEEKIIADLWLEDFTGEQ